MKEILSMLEIAITEKMNNKKENFWNNENLPSIEFDNVNIINPFYDEDMRNEVDPIEYYNITTKDIERFCNYYL